MDQLPKAWVAAAAWRVGHVGQVRWRSALERRSREKLCWRSALERVKCGAVQMPVVVLEKQQLNRAV